MFRVACVGKGQGTQENTHCSRDQFRMPIHPDLAGLAAPQQPGDEACGRIIVRIPLVSRGLLVDGVTRELAIQPIGVWMRSP